jgi:acyl-ACP thioesterase
MAEPLVPLPDRGRTFATRRRAHLADLDARGRVRLDAVARFLQDSAIEDVDETGWGLPEHVWFVRAMRIDVEAPLLADRDVEIVTWCSGVGAIAAGRRWSISGDRGGRVEVDSVWIHLAPNGVPARIEDFGLYAAAADGRRVSTRTALPEPSATSPRLAWPLRATDIDLHGHVNNAVYWQAVEHLVATTGPDARRPLRARLDYREPVDLGDELELTTSRGSDHLAIGFVVGERVKAVASVAALRGENR